MPRPFSPSSKQKQNHTLTDLSSCCTSMVWSLWFKQIRLIQRPITCVRAYHSSPPVPTPVITGCLPTFAILLLPLRRLLHWLFSSSSLSTLEYNISAAAIAIFSLFFMILGTLCVIFSFGKGRDYLLRPAGMFFAFAGQRSRIITQCIHTLTFSHFWRDKIPIQPFSALTLCCCFLCEYLHQCKIKPPSSPLWMQGPNGSGEIPTRTWQSASDQCRVQNDSGKSQCVSSVLSHTFRWSVWLFPLVTFSLLSET